MTNPATGPRFRLAPGVALRGGRRPPVPNQDGAQATGGARPSPPAQPVEQSSQQPVGFRNTSWDRAALAVSIDPVWLLAPLFARDCAGLTPDGDAPGPLAHTVARLDVMGTDLAAASADWPSWWAAALAYRPGTPAPRATDLIADSPALTRLWARSADAYRAWLTTRPARRPGEDASSREVERQALARFAATNDRAPGRWTVRILEIPVTGSYLHSPEPRRLVVSAALRGDVAAYAAALAAELPRHF